MQMPFLFYVPFSSPAEGWVGTILYFMLLWYHLTYKMTLPALPWGEYGTFFRTDKDKLRLPTPFENRNVW